MKSEKKAGSHVKNTCKVILVNGTSMSRGYKAEKKFWQKQRKLCGLNVESEDKVFWNKAKESGSNLSAVITRDVCVSIALWVEWRCIMNANPLTSQLCTTWSDRLYRIPSSSLPLIDSLGLEKMKLHCYKWTSNVFKRMENAEEQFPSDSVITV